MSEVISLMKRADHQALVVDYNATAAPYPSDMTIIDLFREQVTRSPDAEAIRFGNAMLTYRQLDQRSDQMATHLSSIGAGPGRIAVVLMEHSIEVVVAILGVLKSGAAYVPLDAATPKGRIATILEDISRGTGRAPVAITQARLQSLVSPNLADIVVLDADFDLISSEPKSSQASAAAPDGTAYIIFTSGSTGSPKGVEVQHRSLVNYIWWAARVYSSGERLAWPLFSSLAFDLTVTTLFTPLITGGRILVYLGDPGMQSMVALKVIDDNAVDIMKLTPAHLAMIRERNLETTRLRKLIVGGEDFKTRLAREITKAIPAVEIYNEYGPTEATVGCMTHRFDIHRDQAASVPIGVPAANAGIYVLTETYRPTGPGIIGEMFIAGDGLARGYLNRADLTEERFRTVTDPRDGASKLRLYKTGDLARWNSEGRLEYLGRADHQVKINGTRVELGEIEARLLKHPDVQECAVAVMSSSVAKSATQLEARTGHGEPSAEQSIARLVAYFVSSRPLSAADLRAHLAEELLESMIPTHYVRLQRMPLTSNGKIDRASLAEWSAENDQPAEEFLAPFTDTEKTLAALWRDLLKIKSVGRGDSFFDLGGHSLLVTRAVSRMKKTFGVDVQLRDLFEHPTLAGLAESIDRMGTATDAAPPLCQEKSREEIFRFHARGARPPLYFFNGDLVIGHLSVRRAAELIGPDYEIISIDPHGLRGEPIPPSIEEMAADRLPLILERQASGPFLLGGKCNGAVVAFEAARQLMAAGHKVEMVAMVDPPTINARPVTRAVMRLMKPAVSAYRLRWTYQLLAALEIFLKAPAREKITRLKQFRIAKLNDGLNNPNSEISPALWEAYSGAMAEYLPAPLEVPVSFYAGASDGRAWRLSSQIEVIEVAGEHNDTLTSGAELLVDHLRQRIDHVTAGSAEPRFNRSHAVR